jgi:hypothetical protein
LLFHFKVLFLSFFILCRIFRSHGNMIGGKKPLR